MVSVNCMGHRFWAKVSDWALNDQLHHTEADASAASRINCDCVANVTMRCRSHSARAASLNARCALTSVACCFTSRCDPHSTACSVLVKVGMQNFFNGQFIGRYLDETVGRCFHRRTSVAPHQVAPSWL